MKYSVLLEPCAEGGYTVTWPALPGCISEGDTYKSALENIRDAIRVYLRAVAREMDLLGKDDNVRIAEVTV